MRKTASKMSDLTVSGKIVQSSHKTRSQYNKGSSSPVKQQKRFSNSMHKVSPI